MAETEITRDLGDDPAPEGLTTIQIQRRLADLDVVMTNDAVEAYEAEVAKRVEAADASGAYHHSEEFAASVAQFATGGLVPPPTMAPANPPPGHPGHHLTSGDLATVESLRKALGLDAPPQQVPLAAVRFGAEDWQRLFDTQKATVTMAPQSSRQKALNEINEMAGKVDDVSENGSVAGYAARAERSLELIRPAHTAEERRHALLYAAANIVLALEVLR